MGVSQCPKCQTVLTIVDDLVGQTVACPNCGVSFVVPVVTPAPDPEVDELIKSFHQPNTPPVAPEAIPPAEFVYVLSNSAMPGMCKIGRTDRDPETRASELSRATGVPVPFVVAWWEEVSDSCLAEQEIHRRLDEHRSSKSREFFQLELKAAILVVQEICADFQPQPKSENEPNEIPPMLKGAQYASRKQHAPAKEHAPAKSGIIVEYECKCGTFRVDIERLISTPPELPCPKCGRYVQRIKRGSTTLINCRCGFGFWCNSCGREGMYKRRYKEGTQEDG